MENNPAPFAPAPGADGANAPGAVHSIPIRSVPPMRPETLMRAVEPWRTVHDRPDLYESPCLRPGARALRYDVAALILGFLAGLAAVIVPALILAGVVS